MPFAKIGPFYLGEPNAKEIERVEGNARSLPFNFPHLGVTRSSPPLPGAIAAEGWTVDHNRVVVGRGRAAYRRAQQLLQSWRQFDLGWASVSGAPVQPGAPVVVTAFSLFCWTCNPLRVSYVEEGRLPGGGKALPPWVGAPPSAVAGAPLREQRRGQGPWPWPPRAAPAGGKVHPLEVQAATRPRGRRFAYAHTTLRGHQISGEERFSVAWNADDDTVWYEIYTLSRPGSWITAATHPLLRAFQRKFAADSCDAMQREMAAAAGGAQR